MSYYFKSSCYLKSSEQEKRPLIIQCRIAKEGKVGKIATKIISVKDTDGSVIKLTENQWSDQMVINHELSVRYNTLKNFTIQEMEMECLSQLQKNGFINKSNLRSKVERAVRSSFSTHLSDRLNSQKIEYTHFDGVKIKYDKEVLERYQKTEFPSELNVVEVGDGITEVVDNIIEDEEDAESYLIGYQREFDEQKKKEEISKLNIADRFHEGHYDKTNIGHLFASVKYRDMPKPYRRLAIRVYEYHYRTNASLNIHHITTDWVEGFFTFLIDHGYTKLNTKIFDPFNFDGTCFDNKEVLKYNIQNVYKMLEQFQRVLKVTDRNAWDKIDFEKVKDNLEEKTGVKKNKKGTRKKHNLMKEELDQLLYYNFTSNKLDDYKRIFLKHYGLKDFDLKLEHLQHTRDLFILMIMSGGLRGYDELLTLRFDQKNELLNYDSEKTKRYKAHQDDTRLTNPTNGYTKYILNKHNNKIPELKYSKNYCLETQKQLFRKLLRTIAEIAGLDREIFVKGEYLKIYEAISPYFARKAFAQITYDSYGLSKEQIKAHIGHEGKKSTLDNNYLDEFSIPAKRRTAALITI